MTALLGSTPAADGFAMPGEFAPHRGCWMLWPERTDTWREGAKPAQAAFATVAEAIAAAEPVTVGVSARQYENARARLSPRVRVVEMSANDAWMRDVGPSFLTDGRGGLRAVDWRFNGWGGHYNGLYFPWDLDEQVAGKVAEIEGADRYRAPIVLEGGSIHVDGEGTVLTTAECLLSPGRNPALGQAEIEAALLAHLGAERVIWLPRGVVDDETTGHVDNLVHLCAPGVVALTWTDDTGDPQHARSAEALEMLSSARDARGRPFEVVKLPMPGPLHMTAEEAAGLDRAEHTAPREAGMRLAASYANFYVANGRVVFPLLDVSRDAEAAAVLARLFPGREVVGVPGREILLGGGNIHCITQQVPA